VTVRLSGALTDPLAGASSPLQNFILRGEIIDTGVGMDPTQMHRLFRAFSQLDSSSTRRHGGTGLGLVISKRLCELMKGDITVESALGVGSTFRFHVTMRAEASPTLSPVSTPRENRKTTPAIDPRLRLA
jgi:nitrogen-specific signal transduction histidine kinase